LQQSCYALFMARRSIFITGASRGIGAAIAREFADLGDRVAIHYGQSEELAKEVLVSLKGSGHIAVQADLRNADEIKHVVDEAAETFGGIDVLINNAGVFLAHPIETSTYEDWQKAWSDTLDINLIGAANTTWCAVQHMPRTGDSRIVNVGSRGAFRGEPKSPAYGASKAALSSFGQSIAQALAPLGISVTTLAPGFVNTDMAAQLLNSPEGAGIRAQSPFDRVPTPEEVAKAVLFLASPEAQWASGAILDFNGASYLRM
jgi:3-oxoacyl-[acyl-carrier protein] reductase